MHDQEATEVVARIGHDPDALEAFYRQHVDAIQRFIARRVDDPYLVADLTVEVFLAAVHSARKAPALRGEPVQWLYGVARNVVAAEWRRSAREKRTYDRAGGYALVDEDDLVRLEERIDAEAAARPLYAAMGDLSEAERAVFELVALEGLSVAEAARVLGVGVVAARMRLMRARRRLRHHVEQSNHADSMALSEVLS